ncbi:SMC-Scp complex subunit ScpB [Thermodesulfobacteriota bacterium]
MENSTGLQLEAIIEALVFVSDAPITLDRLVKALEIFDRSDVREAAERLKERYDRDGSGLKLEDVSGGYQLRTRPEVSKWVHNYLGAKPAKMSRAALETLAIVAYNQPAVRAEIDRIRGVDSGGVLKTLCDLKLVRILGRKDIPGRPFLYCTTKEFLEIFGLKAISSLPSLREIEEVAKDQEVQLELEMMFGGDDDADVVEGLEEMVDGADGEDVGEGGDEPDQSFQEGEEAPTGADNLIEVFEDEMVTEGIEEYDGDDEER